MLRWLKSARYATNGIRNFFLKERNAQIQFVLFLIAIISGVILKISTTEWSLVLLCSAMVFGLELINSSIESLLDHLHPEEHKIIGKSKDLAAGGVLLVSVFSAVVGGIIFLPKYIHYFTTLFAQ
ncbi:MAG: diacylglycerol kinase [Bacteroidetes bacterium]|nr:diacylglycerol kinase [Bacteroidota bacterium]